MVAADRVQTYQWERNCECEKKTWKESSSENDKWKQLEKHPCAFGSVKGFRRAGGKRGSDAPRWTTLRFLWSVLVRPLHTLKISCGACPSRLTRSTWGSNLGCCNPKRANLTGLVLGCIEAKFCKKICVWKLSPRSTQCTPLHSSKITFFQNLLECCQNWKFANIFRNVAKLNFARFYKT